MEIEINPRGNGACPLCERMKDCSIRKTLVDAMVRLPDDSGNGMELVIYSCPAFVEKDQL
jgi:hypothetical protein